MARCVHGFERAVIPCAECNARERVTQGKPKKKRNRVPYAPGQRPPHPAFKDLMGQTFAGATVIGRAANNESGTAIWILRLPCGHEREMQGIQIRAYERGRGFHCAQCKADTQ